MKHRLVTLIALLFSILIYIALMPGSVTKESALQVFEKRRIDDLPVCDAEGKLVGMVDIQDLPKMKVI